MTQLEEMDSIKLSILNNLPESSNSRNENIIARWNRISLYFNRILYILVTYFVSYILFALVIVHSHLIIFD